MDASSMTTTPEQEDPDRSMTDEQKEPEPIKRKPPVRRSVPGAPDPRVHGPKGNRVQTPK
jgi:hypothetical protein